MKCWSLEVDVWGKNRRGTPRLEYPRQIKEDEGCGCYIEMEMLAQDSLAWKVASDQPKDSL